MATGSALPEHETRTRSLSDYWPLLALVLVSALAASALTFSGFGYARGGDMFPSIHRSWMHAYMGLFLVVFALLKLFDPGGFARGFLRYDLVARAAGRWWAYLYPFLELALGLSYLAFFEPTETYVATIILFAVGAAGVFAGLRRGLDIDCPCMGNILKVPLSTVTLTEDLLMIAMAAALLLLT
jgi:uncharacterized membrane protein HdeD (DUF308 family)